MALSESLAVRNNKAFVDERTEFPTGYLKTGLPRRETRGSWRREKAGQGKIRSGNCERMLKVFVFCAAEIIIQLNFIGCLA